MEKARQELKQLFIYKISKYEQRETRHTLAFCFRSASFLYSYTVWGPKPGSGSSHIDEESRQFPIDRLTAQHGLDNSLRLSYQVILGCVKLTVKTNQRVMPLVLPLLHTR